MAIRIVRRRFCFRISRIFPDVFPDVSNFLPDIFSFFPDVFIGPRLLFSLFPDMFSGFRVIVAVNRHPSRSSLKSISGHASRARWTPEPKPL